MPILDQRGRDQEARLIAALQLVEDAIVGSSADILRVDLFSPEILRLPGDGDWRVTGIVATQDRAGKPVHVRYAAAVSFTCLPYADPACGKIKALSIEGQPLVVDGAVVAELQDVLGVPADSLAGTAPSTSETVATAPSGTSESGTMPAPQLETGTPPETPPEAADSSAPTATEAPTTESAPDSSAASVPAAPSQGTVPIEGDRLIFLTQKRLKEMGYDPGPVDGQVGPRTTSAIQVYQRRAGLAVDGLPSAALLGHMSHAASAAAQ